MELPDFLTRTEYGGIRLAGHRIGLELVVDAFNKGDSAEGIVSRYPTLRLSHVYKVIGFYLENQTEIDQYVANLDAEYEKLSAAGKHLDIPKLRARLEVIRQKQSRPAGI